MWRNKLAGGVLRRNKLAAGCCGAISLLRGCCGAISLLGECCGAISLLGGVAISLLRGCCGAISLLRGVVLHLEVAEDLDVVEGDELAQRREAHVVNVAAQRRAGRQAKAGKRENELLTDAWTTTPLRRARRPLRIILCCIILYYIILY